MSGKQQVREMESPVRADMPELANVETFKPSPERQAEIDQEYIQFLEARLRNLEMLLGWNHTKQEPFRN
jgi:hypothetical protein